MIEKYYMRKFIAGLFFFLCIAMIFGVVFLLGLERGFIEPKFRMTVLFQKVGGLTIGAPVRLSGVNVGTVYDIDFLQEEIEGRGVVVGLSLFEKYRKQLSRVGRVAIITEGVLGEKIVEMSVDPQFYVNDFDAVMFGEDPFDVENLAVTFGEAAEALLETSSGIDSMLGELKEFSFATRRLMLRIEQRIIDGNLFKVF